jgi:hypothetical protein
VTDVLQPLDSASARKLMARILAEGVFTVTTHAKRELAKDGMTTVDAVNVIRGGVVEPPEWENGEWRYRIRTSRMYVVVAFESEDELVLVTAWRIRQ